MYSIPFTKPYLSGKESAYLNEAIQTEKLSGDGKFTHQCHQLLRNRYHFRQCLLTTSCTDALELAALLLNIQPGDEVIMPSFTFVSTANAFLLRGASIVFCDSKPNHPNMDETKLEALITPRTKVIVPVHYGGVACDMNVILSLAHKYNLFVVEDAAQAIDSYYTFPDGTQKALGSIGHMGAISFHETKNIQCGEGGLLVINDERFLKRAEILREKGTNRSAFFRGEINKYGWVDIGSSFLPSELNAAFLYAQLQVIDEIQQKRKTIWNLYAEHLAGRAAATGILLPEIPAYGSNNAHVFYLTFSTEKQRADFLRRLKEKGIAATFHYISLHSSPYFIDKHDGRELTNSDRFSNCNARLPLFNSMTETEAMQVIETIKTIF